MPAPWPGFKNMGNEFMRISFVIPGPPRTLARPRISGKGMYDPMKAAKKAFALLATQHAPRNPLASPVCLVLRFYMSRPKKHFFRVKGLSDPNLIKGTAPFWHTATPDLSNLIKFVEDALTGLFWVDDSVICFCQARKIYAAADECRTEVEIDLAKAPGIDNRNRKKQAGGSC